MTKQELNRDIKRLLKSFADLQQRTEDGEHNDYYHEYIENKLKPEFERLYRADQEFNYMNAESIKIMLRINVRHRFVPFHHFGLRISFPGTNF